MIFRFGNIFISYSHGTFWGKICKTLDISYCRNKKVKNIIKIPFRVT